MKNKENRFIFLGIPDKRFPMLKTGNTYTIQFLKSINHKFTIKIVGHGQCVYDDVVMFGKNWMPE